METGARLKKYRDVCRKGMTQKSAMTEHVWENQHPIAICREEISVLDHGSGQKLENLHIQMTQRNVSNQDGGLELHGLVAGPL